MDWFLYDNGLHHERVKYGFEKIFLSLNFNMQMRFVFKSRLNKFFNGCLPQNLLSPLLNMLSQILDRVC